MEGSGFISGKAFELMGKRFARPVQFAADGVGGLGGELSDLVVAEVLVRDQEENEAVLFRQGGEGFLDAIAQFLSFETAQG